MHSDGNFLSTYFLLNLFSYGQHISENSYWFCHEPETIKRIFERLRNFDGAPNTVRRPFLLGRLWRFVCALTDSGRVRLASGVTARPTSKPVLAA